MRRLQLSNLIIIAILLLSSNIVISESSTNDDTVIPIGLSSGISSGVSINQAKGEGPLIGELFPNLKDPSSAQDVIITAPVYDEDGIDPNPENKTLFWKYDTLNSTELLNTTMTLDADEFVWIGNVEMSNEVDYPMQRSGNYSAFGQEVNFETDWKFSEFAYENIISIVDFRLEARGNDDNIVYYRVETKNITTGEWELAEEIGTPCCTEDYLRAPTPQFDTIDIAGFRVFAVSFNADIPQFETITIRQDQLTATIPASNSPSFVSYYVTANDTTGNYTTSPTYELLMDTDPQVAFNQLPTVVGGDQQLVVNVTVTDSDNITTIDDASVLAYYKLEDEEDYTKSIILNHFNDTTNFTAIYTNTLIVKDLGNTDLKLDIMVNATDMVDGREGRTGSNTAQVTIDNLAPEVKSITFDPRSPLVNITSSKAQVYLEVEFTDPSGIRAANLLYSSPSSSSYITISMLNVSILLPGDNSEIFTVIVPAMDTTGYVDYYFEVTDFLNNTDITSLNYYYSDGEGPTVDSLLWSPTIISNETEVYVLYNASDTNDIMSETLWYSFDDGETWASDTPESTLSLYTKVEIEPPFNVADFVDLPFYLNNSDFTYLPLKVNQSTNLLFQVAELELRVNHDSLSDIRIWVMLDDGQQLLIYDRLPGSGQRTITVDLLELGVDKSFFQNSNFTLVVQDFSTEYVGSIQSYKITLFEVNYPLGYEMYGIIPASQNDTNVIFYLEMIDDLFNVKNSTISTYYAD
ncbi:MAG: hypothetical protein ACXAD7_22730, partial [Candidatus Kariarchaeaceae archaeon]